MLTQTPTASTLMYLVLKSLQKKLDVAAAFDEVVNIGASTQNINIQRLVADNGPLNESKDDAVDVSGDFEQAKYRRWTHRVYVAHALLNEYKDNPELIGGAFVDLLPLGFTKNDLGNGDTLRSKIVRTWLLSHDCRFAKHRFFNILCLIRR